MAYQVKRTNPADDEGGVIQSHWRAPSCWTLVTPNSCSGGAGVDAAAEHGDAGQACRERRIPAHVNSRANVFASTSPIVRRSLGAPLGGSGWRRGGSWSGRRRR